MPRHHERQPDREFTDALRGVALLAVFAFHAILELNIGNRDGTAEPGFLGRLVMRPILGVVIRHLGDAGVQLFFVISGYCIHASVTRWNAAHPAETTGARWRAYGLRRVRRIYPLYLLVISALALLAGPPRFDQPSTAKTWGVHALLLQNIWPGHVNLLNPSLWSLAVEAQWYALYPLLWIGLRRLGAARTALIAGAVEAAWLLVIPDHAATRWLDQLPFRWTVLFVAGVLIAETSQSPFWHAARASVNRIGSAALIGPLARLGRISYAAYLIHQPILTAIATTALARGVRTVEAGPFVLLATVGIVTTGALAYFFERVMTHR